MSLIIESSLDTLYQVVSSKSFVKAIFSMKDKEGIKKSCDGNKMVFDRLYNVKELENVDELKDIQIPENITTMMEKHLGHINIIFSTTQEIIHSDDNGFLIKYTSILTQPEFIYTIVGSARLILYVRMSVNKNDPEKIYWTKPVHEQLVGYKKYAALPGNEEYCLHHPKDIDRQERQNNFYEGIQ